MSVKGDAIRPTGDPDRTTVTGATIRRAEPADLDALLALESEHWRHYALPPMLMAAHGCLRMLADTHMEAPEHMTPPVLHVWLQTVIRLYMAQRVERRGQETE